MPHPTIPQLRAARAYLDMSQTDLAREAGVSFTTTQRMEIHGLDNMLSKNARRILDVFERRGIVFLEDGLRLLRSEQQVSQ